jgi:pimeloyl-ACP methyl ester carboxylesterase
MYDAQLAALSGQARLIIPDMRGFGQSTPGDNSPALMETFAEDALALLDALDVGPAVVAGLSMGGYVALALLRRDPGRVRALVLADSQVGADDEAARARREALAEQVLLRGPDVLVESQLPRLLSASAAEATRTRVAAMIGTTSPQGAAAALRGMALRPDARDILSRFGGPLLVVVGAEDSLTPPEKARAMAALVPTATLVEIAGAGHLSNLEAPERFNQALADFLRPLRASATA